MPVPTIDPNQRDPASIAPTDSYRPADPVWVHRNGTWCPGVVDRVSGRAATVTYRPGAARGTGVDTLTAASIHPREEHDPVLDPTR